MLNIIKNYSNVLWVLPFVFLAFNAVSQENQIQQWRQTNNNAISFNQRVTIYILPGDFEGDYIFKIQPSTDAILESFPFFKTLDARKLAVVVDLKMDSLKEIRVKNVECLFLEKDKEKIERRADEIEQYFSTLSYYMIDPKDGTRDAFSLNFTFFNYSNQD